MSETTWVFVEDRLPEHDGPHLVHAPSQDPAQPLLAIAWWHADRQEWSGLWHGWTAAITHWMPLPEPPQIARSTFCARRA